MDDPFRSTIPRQIMGEAEPNRACSSSGDRLTVQGIIRLDHLGEFQECLEEVVTGPGPSATFDFTGCKYLSSVFVGYLVDGILRAREAGKSVQVRVSPALGGFFQMAHLDQLFPYSIGGPMPRMGSGARPAVAHSL